MYYGKWLRQVDVVAAAAKEIWVAGTLWLWCWCLVIFCSKRGLFWDGVIIDDEKDGFLLNFHTEDVIIHMQ